MLPEYTFTVGDQSYTLRLPIREQMKLEHKLGCGIEQLLVRARLLQYGTTEMVTFLSAGLRGGWKKGAKDDEINAILERAAGGPVTMAWLIDGAHYPLTLSLHAQIDLERALGYGIEQLALRVETGNYGTNEMKTVLLAGLREGWRKSATEDDICYFMDFSGRHAFRATFRQLVGKVIDHNRTLRTAFSAFLLAVIDAQIEAAVGDDIEAPSAQTNHSDEGAQSAHPLLSATQGDGGSA
ncbi:MAG: GTA-gp10 family protein [Pseudonocardiaceae bacterium]